MTPLSMASAAGKAGFEPSIPQASFYLENTTLRLLLAHYVFSLRTQILFYLNDIRR